VNFVSGFRGSVIAVLASSDNSPTNFFDPSHLHRLVLCIASIYIPPASSNEPSSPNAHLLHSSISNAPLVSLELTDGWYKIHAQFDARLSGIVRAGLIKVGSKLATCNATLKLHGSDDGIDPMDSNYSSSPLNPSASLQLNYNSTRRARWDARLGWSRGFGGTGLLKVDLSSVEPGGGTIPLMDVVVCRKFPKMFSQTVTRADGTSTTTFLTEAAEEQAKREWETKMDKR